MVAEELAPDDGALEPPAALSFFSVSDEAELDADEDGGVAGVVD